MISGPDRFGDGKAVKAIPAGIDRCPDSEVLQLDCALRETMALEALLTVTTRGCRTEGSMRKRHAAKVRMPPSGRWKLAPSMTDWRRRAEYWQLTRTPKDTIPDRR